MRIEALYFEGFTERLLRWRLEVNGGNAHLEAHWNGCPAPLRATFRFDEDQIRSAIPRLAPMREDYRPPYQDLEDRILVIEGGGVTTRLRVYGAALLVREHPETKDFMKVWKILDDAVGVHLSPNLRP